MRGYGDKISPQNSTDNNHIQDVIGQKSDFITLPFVPSANSIIAYLQTGYYHVHGISFVYPDKANAVVLTSASGAWNATGTLIEIIPAGVLNLSAFDLHWVDISEISANCQLQIDIYSGEIGSEIKIGSSLAHRNSAQSREGATPVQIPQQLSGSRISGRLIDSTSGQITCGVKFMGHYYKAAFV